jgi:hypothetical protein
MNGISDAKSLTYDNYLSLSLDARGLSITVKRQNGKFFGLLDGLRNLAAPNDMHHGIGNPLSEMIADPDRHARNSLFATCGTAARSAVADRALDFR